MYASMLLENPLFSAFFLVNPFRFVNLIIALCNPQLYWKAFLGLYTADNGTPIFKAIRLKIVFLNLSASSFILNLTGIFKAKLINFSDKKGQR